MKKLFFMFALLCVGMTATAQSTRIIKGAVVDKNGNPLPGANVEATNGAESTIVDADGTFSLEVPRWLNSVTATYPGMRKKKMKVKDGDMVFRLNHDQGRWFVNLESGYVTGSSSDDGFTGGGAGLMGGYLDKWGGYAKVFWRITERAQAEAAVPVATAGVIKSITPKLYLNAGVGYAKLNWRFYDSWSDGVRDYKDEWSENEDACVVELGLIYNPLNHLTIHAGYAHITDFSYTNGIFQVGIGYAF